MQELFGEYAFVATEQLQQARQFWDSLPFAYVLAGHCLFCASLAPEYKEKYLVHYLLTHLWGFGGGILTTILIMDPKVAPHAFLTDNLVGVVWTAAWWAVTYAPFGIIERLHNRWYIKMLTKGCTSLLRAKLILARVDLAARLYPGVVAAPLLLGTLAGCGGRLLADLVKWGWTQPGSVHAAELSNPAWVSRSALLASAVYYLLGHQWRVVPLDALAGLIITLKMVHSFATDFAGRPLDVTDPLSSLLLKISNIPDPAAAKAADKPQGKKAGAAASSDRDTTQVVTSATAATNGVASPQQPVRRSGRTRPAASKVA